MTYRDPFVKSERYVSNAWYRANLLRRMDDTVEMIAQKDIENPSIEMRIAETNYYFRKALNQ